MISKFRNKSSPRTNRIFNIQILSNIFNRLVRLKYSFRYIAIIIIIIGIIIGIGIGIGIIIGIGIGICC